MLYEVITGADHRPPLLLHRQGHLGEAVAGEVDQGEGAVDVEEVEQLGAPGGGGGAHQPAAVEEGVDQAALADVAAPGKGDLRQGRGRAGRQGRGAGDEAGRVSYNFV